MNDIFIGRNICGTRTIILRLIGTFIFIIIVFALSACTVSDSSNTAVKNVSKMLDIDLSDAELLTYTDSHGGFHGDGTAFVSLRIEQQETKEEISSQWNRLPLTKNLTSLVYGTKDDDVSVGPFLTENGELLFPQIENGYYYFYDRHSESEDPFDDSEILDRYSFNFVLTIYDTDTGTLYYCKYDT